MYEQSCIRVQTAYVKTVQQNNLKPVRICCIPKYTTLLRDDYLLMAI